MPYEARPFTTPTTSLPPPLVHPKVPPATMSLTSLAGEAATPPPLAPQGEPLVPIFVREALNGLEELFGCIINHLEKMADKLNSIELRIERLERTVAPELLHHLRVPLHLQTQSHEDEDEHGDE